MQNAKCKMQTLTDGINGVKVAATATTTMQLRPVCILHFAF
jgi:hypothetical protein